MNGQGIWSRFYPLLDGLPARQPLCALQLQQAPSWHLPREYSITVLGALPGYIASGGVDSQPYSINNSGQAVGYAEAANGYSYAVLFSNGTVTSLGPLGDSLAYSINNHGQAVGVAATASGYHATLWSNGTVTDLGTLPGGTFSLAYSINNSGQAVGWATNASGVNDAAVFSNGTATDLNNLINASLGWN